MVVWTFQGIPITSIALIIYFILVLRYIFIYLTSEDKEKALYQVGAVEVVLFIIVIGIIAWSLRESGKNKQLKKADYLLDVKQNYNRALETYIGVRDWDKAGETIVKSPPGTQIVLLRRLQSFLPQSKIKSIFMKLGETYTTQRQTSFAASAFLLAEMPWRAAQTYITDKNVPAAIDIINTTPVFSQDKSKATRNLAKFAFDNNHPVEAAYLLQSIGAEDEAVAVLIAAGQNSSILGQFQHNNNRTTSTTRVAASVPVNNSVPNVERASTNQNSESSSQPQTEKKIDTSVKEQPSSITNRSEISANSPFFILKQELTKSQEAIKSGKISEAEETLNKFSSLLSRMPSPESEESMQLKSEYSTTYQALQRLNDARNAFKARKIEQAQIIYSELLETAGDLFSAEVFAEAGLTYEYEPSDKEIASEFFVEASKRAKTTQAAQRYKERADLLVHSINEDLPETPKDEKLVVGKQLTIDPNEKCCVCRRPIGIEGEVVQCNSCKSVAHYPHMAEWLKIKGVCPVCKQKLTMPETTKIALTE